MTGRYRHLTRAIRPAPDLGDYARHQMNESGDQTLDTGLGAIHRRTLLFLLIALLVGGGLLSIVPELAASSVTVASTPAATQSSPTLESAAPPTLEQEDPSPADSALEPHPDPTQTISPIFTPEVQHWAPRIMAWSARHGLDPDIVATIMQIESCGHPGAISSAGARGLFQVMPFHFSPGEDMHDPDTNADRGLAFYNRQLNYTGQDVYLSFAGYNGGYAASGSSYSYWAHETQRYYKWASGIYDEAKAGLSASPTLSQWLAAGGSSLCRQAAQRLDV